MCDALDSIRILPFLHSGKEPSLKHSSRCPVIFKTCGSHNSSAMICSRGESGKKALERPYCSN